MKNRLFLSWAVLVLFFLFSGNIFSQCGNTAVAVLNPNKIKTAIPVGGDFLWDREDLNFVVPYTPGEPEASSISIAGIWLGGYDENGELATSCQSRSASAQADFWAGPIEDASGNTFENGCENFDKVWKVNRKQIKSLIEDFEDNGNIDQDISPNILAWPAKGNPHFESHMGFELPEQEMAPFFDRNDNGTYEPLNGEYPIIDTDWPEVIPNELTWCVFNDLEKQQQITGGNAIGVEVHFMAFGFNCEEDELINQTMFTRHKIFNKSGGNISDFKIGHFNGVKLGSSTYDYIGCDTLLNSFYTYEPDNEDEEHIYPNYGENPPCQSGTLLNQNLDYFTYFIGGGPCDPSLPLTGPQIDFDHYNYLSGKWRDGTPLTYGYYGYNPGTFFPQVNHAFFDNPNNPNGWSTNTFTVNTCVARTLGTTQFDSLQKNEKIILDAAYSLHRSLDSTNLGNVNLALENIPLLQSFYDNGFNECEQIATSVGESFLENINFDISPNPNNGQFSIFSKNNTENISLDIFDLNGQKLWSGEISVGQENLEINLLDKISNGIYFLKAVNKSGDVFSQKIIFKKQ